MKDDKQKVSKRHVGIVAKLAKRFARIQTSAQDGYVPAEEAMVNAILDCCCLEESQRRGGLDKEPLFIAGDSTKGPVHGNAYGKKVIGCIDFNCDCKRDYNAPEPTVAYDAHRDAFVVSLRLYQLTSCPMQRKPGFPPICGGRPAREMIVSPLALRGIAPPNAWVSMRRVLMPHMTRLPCIKWLTIYGRRKSLFHKNTTHEGNYQQLPMESITAHGIPICPEGHEMYFCGYCKDPDRLKWRCPLKATIGGNALDEDCHCSSSDYGRVVYTHPKDNKRLYPKIPRNSLKWKAFYDHRTAAERVFKRQKLDFKLTFFKTR